MNPIDTTSDPLVLKSFINTLPNPTQFYSVKPQPVSSVVINNEPVSKNEPEINNISISDLYERYQLSYHRINTFEKKYPSTTSLKRDLRIPISVRGNYFNKKMKERMLNSLGVTYYISNMILYLKCHPSLRRKDFLIPIGYIYDGVRIQYYNYDDFIKLKHELFIEYDQVRPISMQQQGIINEIHSILYPHDCQCKIDWFKFGLDCLSYVNKPDEQIKWCSKPKSTRYRFSDLKTPKQQVRLIGNLRQKFMRLNNTFTKSNESILNFINYYYSAILF